MPAESCAICYHSYHNDPAVTDYCSTNAHTHPAVCRTCLLRLRTPVCPFDRRPLAADYMEKWQQHNADNRGRNESSDNNDDSSDATALDHLPNDGVGIIRGYTMVRIQFGTSTNPLQHHQRQQLAALNWTQYTEYALTVTAAANHTNRKLQLLAEFLDQVEAQPHLPRRAVTNPGSLQDDLLQFFTPHFFITTRAPLPHMRDWEDQVTAMPVYFVALTPMQTTFNCPPEFASMAHLPLVSDIVIAGDCAYSVYICRDQLPIHPTLQPHMPEMVRMLQAMEIRLLGPQLADEVGRRVSDCHGLGDFVGNPMQHSAYVFDPFDIVTGGHDSV